jgi:hypothetical protein
MTEKVKKQKLLFLLLIVLISLSWLLAPVTVKALSKPFKAYAPDFDIRETQSTTPSKIKKSTSKSSAQEKALNKLKVNVKNLKVENSSLTGNPNRISSSTQALTEPSKSPAKDIATKFLNKNLDFFNLSTDDISEIKFTHNATAKKSGVTYLAIQQQVNGKDVFGAVLNINVDRKGQILNINGEFIPGINDIINTNVPLLSGDDALAKAAESANIFQVRASKVYGLIYFPLSTEEARLAWNVLIEDAGSANIYQTIIDAVDGTVLFRRNHTQYAHGLVFTSDSPNPDTPTGTSGCTTTTVPPYPDCAVDREDVDFDGRDFFPSSDDHYDWWNDSTGNSDTSTTKSNNAHAKEDSDYDNDDTEGFPTVSGDDFSFAIDLSEEPTVEDSTVQNQSSSIVNSFYWVNRIHDIYYDLGFDETERNFQSDNFGLGGTGGDPVQVDIHDRLATSWGYIYHCNGAFSSTPTDGDPIRMTLLLCDNTAPDPETDAALENLIIIHEYTHGLVKRLVHGIGPYTSQSGGLQDGTCDFMGIAITSEPDDDLTLSYPRGQWYYNNVNGNRRQPYSTDQTVFTRTYGDISDDPDPWPAGEIWCNTLWMARANLVWKHGFDVGGNTMLQLVVDGMKNERSSPDYLDMRDGILLADNTNNSGVNQCILWDAFAKMGMGDSASTTGDNDNNPTEAFDIPSECEPDIRVVAAQDFGSLCIGENQVNQLQILNDGDTGDLIISSVAKIAGSDDITVDALPHPVFIDPGSHENLSVYCQPMTCGTKTATIRIESNDPDQPQIDLDFTCDGDPINPVTTCPDDITRECSESTDPSITGTATATDNCDSDPAITHIDSIIPGICTQTYDIERTWTATDDCGNSDSCVQTINVEDTTAPVLSDIPADITVECDAVPDPATVTSTDNCDTSPTIDFTENRTDGSCPSEYTLTRTWTAIDDCENNASDTQNVAVRDTTPPVIACNSPSTITPPDAPITFAATASDNCNEENPVVVINEYECYKLKKKEDKKIVDKKASCIVSIDNDTITIYDSGGVDTYIAWEASSTDDCGNETEVTCEVHVVNPAE